MSEKTKKYLIFGGAINALIVIYILLTKNKLYISQSDGSYNVPQSTGLVSPQPGNYMNFNVPDYVPGIPNPNGYPLDLFSDDKCGCEKTCYQTVSQFNTILG